MSILEDFEKNQDAVLKRAREWQLVAYINLVSRLLPRHAAPNEVEEGADLSAEALADLVALAQEKLRRIEAESSLESLDGVIPGARGDEHR
jgi:hypothetical protein